MARAKLPTLINRASRRLEQARTSAEVLEARTAAQVALHYARLAKATAAAQADCLRIILRAEGRLVAAIDEGQANGVIPSRGRHVRTADMTHGVGLDAIGVSRQRLNEWRAIAAAGSALVEEMINTALSAGEVPTKADILRRIKREARQAKKATRLAETNCPCTVRSLRSLIKRGITFGCIYADPPWLCVNPASRGAATNHYDGLTIDEICALPVRELSAKDAHLHLWVTNEFLFAAERVFAAWGFTFRSSFVWVKPQLGLGNYWRNSHEFLLTAIRGQATSFADRTLRSWMELPRTTHSTKPALVRECIERASPPPYLELFGRRRVQNWVVWGNEIEATAFRADSAAL